MHHICKNEDNKYYVVMLGKNGEVLSHTQPFSAKQGAWTNIRAQMTVMGVKEVLVQDDTQGEPLIFLLGFGHRPLLSIEEAGPRYIPGKNPKK